MPFCSLGAQPSPTGVASRSSSCSELSALQYLVLIFLLEQLGFEIRYETSDICIDCSDLLQDEILTDVSVCILLRYFYVKRVDFAWLYESQVKPFKLAAFDGEILRSISSSFSIWTFSSIYVAGLMISET